MAPEKTPRVRLTSIPDNGVMVLRGDELDAALLADDASRFRERFSEWGRYGVSAFYASSDDEIDALCQGRLVRFQSIAVFGHTDLEAAGLEIVPTFRTPHVTVCHQVLEELVSRLQQCEHRQLTNAYYVEEDDDYER